MIKPTIRYYGEASTSWPYGSTDRPRYDKVLCSGAGITAKGKTIPGAYANWLSLFEAQARINAVLI